MTDSTKAFLQAHLPHMLDDVRRLVELESPSGDAGQLAKAAHLVAEYAESAGGTTQLLDALDGNCHVRAEWGTGSDRPVLLLGHFDTVWPVGTLARMPFKVERGLAHGPGVFDMKAGMVQGFWAMRALAEAHAARQHVVFLCTSDEETGSGTSRELIEREARNSSAVFVLEPSHQGALKTARKGVGQFRLAAHGRASHAGLDPRAGASAIDELAHQILALQAVANADVGSTVNVGVIAGGTRSNVVADHAWADIDVRFESGSEGVRLAQAIMNLQPRDQRVGLQVTGGINRPPLERTRESEALFARARTIAFDLGFPLLEVAVGGGSDGNFCAAVGARVLDGLGAVGGGAHALDEHVVIEALPMRAALLSNLIASL